MCNRIGYKKLPLNFGCERPDVCLLVKQRTKDSTSNRSAAILLVTDVFVSIDSMQRVTNETCSSCKVLLIL